MATTNGVSEHSFNNLSITEDPNLSTGDILKKEDKETVEAFRHGFSLQEYYKMCLKYYNKEKKIIQISYDDKVQLVAYWKQVSCGKYDPSKCPDVGYFDVIGNDRRAAWEDLGEMSNEEAMKKFCELLEQESSALKPWVEAQRKEIDERERLRKEEEERERRAEEERQRQIEEEEREKERMRLEEEARRWAEEQERRRQEELLRKQQEEEEDRQRQMKQSDQKELNEIQNNPQIQQSQIIPDGKPVAESPVNKVQTIAPASLWTRPKVQEFIQHVRGDPSSIIVVGRGETMTVRVPTHEGGTCLFWEFATEYYDVGFGVSFEWSHSATKNITVHVNESDEEEAEDMASKSEDIEGRKARVDEILPVIRRPCCEEVIVGSHMYPGEVFTC